MSVEARENILLADKAKGLCTFLIRDKTRSGVEVMNRPSIALHHGHHTVESGNFQM